MAKIIWTNKSLKDLKSIFDYISLDSSYYATRFVNRLVLSVDQLEVFPESGRIVPEKEDPTVRDHLSHTAVRPPNGRVQWWSPRVYKSFLDFLLTCHPVFFFPVESVDRLMNETHELGGSTIAVDRATPKVRM